MGLTRRRNNRSMLLAVFAIIEYMYELPFTDLKLSALLIGCSLADSVDMIVHL